MNDAENRVPLGAARLSTAAVVALAFAVIAARALMIACAPIYDDAFITFRYSENWARGLGLVFNPGAPWEPVLGTTTPAYAVWLGLLVRAGLEPVQAALATNLACDGISALLIMALLGRRSLPSMVAVSAFAAVPEIGRISIGGMEPPLLLMLSLASILFAYRGRAATSGIFTALACCTRPEAVLLAAALLWHHRQSARSMLRFLAPVVLIGCLAGGLIWYVYGQPIPQSVLAKKAHSSLGDHAFERMPTILAQAFGPSLHMRILLPIAALGMLRGLFPAQRLRALFFFVGAMVIAYILAGTKTWGWYFYLPLVAWTLGLGLGVESIVERWGLVRELLRRKGLAEALSLAFAVAAVAAQFAVRHVRQDVTTARVYRPMEAWCREHRIAERGATILASDIGAIGYFSRARILDSEGLVWPEALELGHQVDILRRFQPEYVMWVVNDYRLGRFLGEADLVARYRPVVRLNANSATPSPLDVDPRSLPESWEQDYILFERIDPAPPR